MTAVGLGLVCPNFTPWAVEQNALPWAQCTRDADVVGGLGVLERVGVGGELLRLGRVRRRTPWGCRPRCSPAPGSPWPTSPTSQPARVNGTHGAGVIVSGFGAGLGGGRRGGRVDHRRVGVVAGVRGAGGVEDRVGPVGERAGRVGRAVGVVGPVAVADRHAVPVAVQAGERGQDVVGGVRDQRGVVVRQRTCRCARGSAAGSASSPGRKGRWGCRGRSARCRR